jgi:hypothetical protein
LLDNKRWLCDAQQQAEPNIKKHLKMNPAKAAKDKSNARY